MFIFKGFLALVAILATLAMLSFGGNYLGYTSRSFFAPWGEEIRRETMIESRAYSEAAVRSLYSMKREYEAATDPASKATVRAAALHEFQIFPEERLPADLRAWFNSIKG